MRTSRVFSRSNPLTGTIVVAEVVARASSTDEEALGRDILALCRRRLERHKMPALIRFVEKIDLSAAGKVKREAAQE